MKVRDKIICFSNDKTQSFPVKFSNEIYISKGKSPKYAAPVSYRSSYAIKCVVNGEEDYLVDGHLKRLGTGSVLFVQPDSKVQFLKANGLATSIFLEPDAMLEAHKYLLWGDKLLDFPFDSFSTDSVPFLPIKTTCSGPELKRIINMVAANSNAVLDEPFYLELAENVILAQNKLGLEKNNLKFKRKKTRLEIFRRLSVVREYIEDNLYKNISLDELSHVSCLSKYYMVRTFRQLYGKSPYQFHLELKLNKMHALINSDLQIESLRSLASDFGFYEYSVFYKHYMRFFNKKPSLNRGFR